MNNFLSPEQHAHLLAAVEANQHRFVEASIMAGPLTDMRQMKRYKVWRTSALVPHDVMRVFIEKLSGLLHDLQITAYGDGCYFKQHNDNTEAKHSYRRMTFCYYFHRTPAKFIGGELKLFIHNQAVYIEPEDNSFIQFPSSWQHEVLMTTVPSGDFMDSRFCVTGWTS